MVTIHNPEAIAVATRAKLRFTVLQGIAAVEDLWDMKVAHTPTTSERTRSTQDSLNSLAIRLDNELAKIKGEGYVTEKVKGDSDLQLKRDVVIAVLKTLQDEAKFDAKALQRKKDKEYLLGILADKQDDEMKGLSIKELKKRLKAL